MTSGTHLRTVLKRWRVVAVLAVLGAVIAGAVSLLTPATYEARTQLFVAVRTDPGNASSAFQGTSFTQQRVKSYAAIIDSPKVLQPVINELGLATTPQQLGSKVRATVPLDTNLINVIVEDSDPQTAATLADAISEQFANYVSEIEQGDARAASLVTVSVVRPAEIPGSPVSPRTKLNIALGLLVGLGVGVGVAILRENLDTSVKGEDDVEELAHELGREINVIGAIGKDSGAPKAPLIVNADPQSKRAEAFRQLRTNLQFVDVDNPPRSIVVTSSLAVEGKSTTAANLAITLAQAGLRVALVEADLRRPKLAGYMGVEGAVGLTDVLVGRTKVTDVMHRFGNLPLDFLPSGRPAPNPSELLGSRAMLALLRDLESTHDIVLLDAPPLLPVTDAAVMSALAGGALLVVRVGSTTRDQLEEAVESLYAVDARLLGVVLSMVPGRRRSQYDYSYEYSYPTNNRRGARSGKSSAGANGASSQSNGRRGTTAGSGRGSRRGSGS